MSDQQKIVEAAGAQYLGTQDGLVYLNVPQASNTTATIRLAELTEQSVREKIQEKVKQFSEHAQA